MRTNIWKHRPRPVRVSCRQVGVTAGMAVLLCWAPAPAAPPAGQSALLNGMHDIQAASWMKTATSGCDKGWITDLQYIGSSGSTSASCNTAVTAAGISIIQRLDLDGSQSFPKSTSLAPGYAKSFESFVSQCAKIHVWIVGNEPNVSFSKSDPDCSSEAYATAYVEVHKLVHKLSGHLSDLVLVASNSPYSPGCLQSLRMIIDKIKAKGVTPDGFALHAYTQADTISQLSASLVTDSKTVTDYYGNYADECAGGATWNDTFHWHFRIYLDYINKVIDLKGLAGKPVFITESGNACKVQTGNKCYPDADIGYFQALYAEAGSWNKSHTTKIRAITPYRWTKNDDGTGRDFEIGSRTNLLSDLQKAFAKKHQWTTPSCSSSPACTDDSGCTGKSICNLGTGTCQATSACGAGGTCAAGYICRYPQTDCVPICRGSGKVAVTPGKPAPKDTVKLDASHAQGLTNVGMDLHGPAGSVTTSWIKVEKLAEYHWYWSATVGAAGTYRATFTADPAASTVYAIAYFNVGSPTPPKGDGPLQPGPDAGGSGTGREAGVMGGDLPPGTSGAQAGGNVDGGCSCAVARGTAGQTAGPSSPPPSLLVLLLLGLAAWIRTSSRR